MNEGVVLATINAFLVIVLSVRLLKVQKLLKLEKAKNRRLLKKLRE